MSAYAQPNELLPQFLSLRGTFASFSPCDVKLISLFHPFKFDSCIDRELNVEQKTEKCSMELTCVLESQMDSLALHYRSLDLFVFRQFYWPHVGCEYDR
jgi:hypothetical protein